MRTFILGIIAAGAAAAGSAQAQGCQKDTDCKGERVCVQSQCVDPQQVQPQYQQPVQPQYQQPQQPAPQYQQPQYQPQYQEAPPPYPPPAYPPPRRAYYAPPRYGYVQSPLIWGYSGMLGVQSDSFSGGTDVGFLIDGYAELGGRTSPNFGFVGFGDVNFGLYQDQVSSALTIGGGLHFGHFGGLTLGPAVQFINIASANTTLNGIAPAAVAHLSLPIWRAWGFHIQASAAFYGSDIIGGLGIGFGYSN